MKGLMVKDVLLLTQKKMFFAILLVIAIVMNWYMDSSFVIGYFGMMGAILCISTISYDEFDNGFPFLMTLPISPKLYVIEKYLFSILCQLTACAVAIIIQFATLVVKAEPYVASEILLQDLAIVLVTTLFIAFMLPIEIKFGAEKGRTAIFLIAGIFFVIGVIAKTLYPHLQKIISIDTEAVIRKLESLPMAGVEAVLLVIVLVLLLISGFISTKIMQKKEF